MRSTWVQSATFFFAAAAVCLVAAACGGDSDEPGGSAGTGGTGGTGGTSGAAGTAGTGGAAGMAGSAGTAGTGGTAGYGAGGPCEYDDIPGKATITVIEPEPNPSGNSCANEPTLVHYTFAPDDTTIPPEDYDVTKYGYNDGAFHTIQIPGVTPMTPPKSCLEPTGFIVNAELTVIRSVINQGTCTPVMDDFATVDWTLCTAECH